MEKLARRQTRIPALHRLDQNRSNVGAIRPQPRQRIVAAVIKHDEILHSALWNAGGNWSRAGTEKHFVENPVISTAEDHDAVASGNRAADTQRRGNRLTACIAECDALQTEITSEPLREHTGERGSRPDFDSGIELPL